MHHFSHERILGSQVYTSKITLHTDYTENGMMFHGNQVTDSGILLLLF
jgi:hypothetical protein